MTVSARAYQDEATGSSSVRARISALIALIMVYPVLLALFHWSGRQAVDSAGLTAILAWAGVSLFMTLAFSVPALGFLLALNTGVTTADELRLRILAHFAVAVPPLYSAMGAYFILFGLSGYDPYAWATVWMLVLLGLLAKTARSEAVNSRQPPPQWLRIAHGAAAAVAVFAYIAIHLLHNASGLLGADFYNEVQASLRAWYQSSLVEPVIIASFLFLMGSGLVLVTYRITTFRDTWGTVLTTTGAYLAAFLLAHMTAALITARWKFGIETDWAWAAGEPPGLFADPWSVRLIPYYTLAPMAVLAHVACGLRLVLAARGTDVRQSERIARGLMAAGVLLGLLTILALLGLRLDR